MSENYYPEGGIINPALHPAFNKLSIIDVQRGILSLSRKKLAIVGAAESSRSLAPWNDPTYTIAGINGLYRVMPRYDLFFEMHSYEELSRDIIPNQNYLEWLQHSPVPVFMQSATDEFTMSVRYPIEHICQWLGQKYLRSSMALMLAWGIDVGFDEIGLWGVDCASKTEYEHQRPNLEYLIGLARGKGIKIIIPSTSALCKDGPLYGYEDEHPDGPLTPEIIQQRIDLLEQQSRVLSDNLLLLKGGIIEASLYRDSLLASQRGAQIDLLKGVT